MKLFAALCTFCFLLLTASASALAGNFDWTEDFNNLARANPAGFRASLAARFDLGGIDTRKIIGKADCPADAYIILRLAEMSGKTASCVVEQYRKNKNEGWGRLAATLDVETGSNEFIALEEDHDLHSGAGLAKDISFSPDRAMLIMLTRSLCKVEAENRALW